MRLIVLMLKYRMWLCSPDAGVRELVPETVPELDGRLELILPLRTK